MRNQYCTNDILLRNKYFSLPFTHLYIFSDSFRVASAATPAASSRWQQGSLLGCTCGHKRPTLLSQTCNANQNRARTHTGTGENTQTAQPRPLLVDPSHSLLTVRRLRLLKFNADVFRDLPPLCCRAKMQ